MYSEAPRLRFVTVVSDFVAEANASFHGADLPSRTESGKRQDNCFHLP